jgi:hypothetical protein
MMIPFQVTGTNVTLKQPVVFTGSILGETNAARFVTLHEPALSVKFRKVGQSQRGEVGGVADAGLGQPAVSGRVLLGTTNQYMIRAIKATP